MKINDRKGRVSLLALGMLLVALSGWAGQRGLPPKEGILNFGVVSERLYRGAQPDDSALDNLRRLGIKSIINLRTTNDCWDPEPTAALNQGLVYTNVPLKGLGRPTADQIRRILELIDSLPAPVYVHCQHGCDRTGTVVACYRIQHDQWSGEVALREADVYGMSKLERGMRNFVREFAMAKAGPRIEAVASRK
jgi:protein tyrosine/serine phosphatase